ncbi:MAG TPA: adenylate/guanylate cyclase domain-containing protein [Candidatus Dormibacteraeota bacterium]|nr:adenylate/guanylate cyclase domain-containing protein [Candidatus Dormibacteraeota bacterium]
MTDARGVAAAPPRVPAPSGPPHDSEAALAPYVARLALRWLAGSPQDAVQRLTGTLAFVDISGFTRLTEILAARGKAGAEEMTGYLDALFAELLAIAYDAGGELIKWGGDAVLVWFTGESHAARAVDSAWRMQRSIARSGRLRTSAGPATLRMSVGIHSGAFHFFSVGERHRELLVTGPAATATAHMEAVAEAGEVVVSAATAHLLDAACVGAAKQDGFLVARAPHVAAVPERDVAATAVPRTSAQQPPATEGAAPSLCLPAALRDYLLAAPVESEHRQVAVAFVEFGGVDAPLQRGDDRTVAADLDRLLTAVQEICARHGVTFWETDIAEDGGKIMLVAGAPSATGDDAGRMLVAVREILDTECGLRLRAGVNHGRVFVGGFGPAYRRTYSAKGDAVNLAARLMARAAPGEMYASDAVITRSRTAVSSQALEPFHVKGKAHPVRAHRVGAMTARRLDEGAGTRPLVGRDHELEQLTGHLGAAFAGAGRCVEVIGAPGTGKSRLIQELEGRATGARLLSVVCQEYQAVVPYASMRVLLRQCLDLDPEGGPAATGVALSAAVRRLAPQLLPWLPLLAGVAGADVEPTQESSALDERFRRQRLEEAFLDLLTAGLRRPALIVLEDAEWIDDASAALVHAVAGALGSRPWLLLVARRPSGAASAVDGLPGATRLELQPLSREAVARLLRVATADRPLPPHFRDALADRSGGNPLFLLELAGAGLQEGFASALPDSVEGVFAAQIDRLAPADRRALRIASVLGVQVPVAVLADMTGGAFDPDPLLGDFLTPDGPDVLRFRHNMLRDAAYEGLSYARRRELHALAAQVLERRAGARPAEIAGLLAVHFGHAGDHPQAWRYARLAGQRARAVNASVEAATFFEQALHAGRDLAEVTPAELLEVAEALGDARTRLGQFADAEATYRGARRWAATGVDAARLQYKAALATDRAGNYPKTLRSLTRARHSLDGAASPPALRLGAEIRAQYGLVRHRQGRGHDAVRLLQDAVSLADAAAAPEVLATALLYLDIAELTAGFGGDGSHARRALAIAQQFGDQPWLEARALNQLGIRAYYAGNWSQCIASYADSRAACERAGDRWTAAVESANIAEVLADQGHLAEAEPILDEALETYRAAGTSAFVADGTRILGRLAARRGDAARSRELLAAARAIYAADGESLQVVLTDAIVAESLALCGDTQGAADLAARVVDAAATLPGRHLVTPLALRVLGVSLWELGSDLPRARASLQESIDVARAHDARYELALSLQALSDLWPEETTTAELDERDALFRELGVVETGRRLLPAGLPEARV